MQEFIDYGLGWLYELICCVSILGYGVLTVYLYGKLHLMETKIQHMKAMEDLYKKELAQYESVSKDFYEKVWTE